MDERSSKKLKVIHFKELNPHLDGVLPDHSARNDHHLALRSADPAFRFISQELGARGREQTAEGGERRVESREQRAESEEQRASDQSKAKMLTSAKQGVHRAKDKKQTAEQKVQGKGKLVVGKTDGISDYTRWLGTLRSPQSGSTKEAALATTANEASIGSPKEKKTGKKSKSKKVKPSRRKQTKSSKKRVVNTESLILSDDIISETLAVLLASQGHIDHAVAMYEKLGLKYPAKTANFAAEIEKLIKSR